MTGSGAGAALQKAVQPALRLFAAALFLGFGRLTPRLSGRS